MKKKAVVLGLVGLQWSLGTCTDSAANGTKKRILEGEENFMKKKALYSV